MEEEVGEGMSRKGSGDFSIGSQIWPGTSKLLEEMGELTQVLGKLIAIAGEENHWDGTNLVDRMLAESADVIAALDFWTEQNFTLLQRLDRKTREEFKLQLFQEWQEDGVTDG